MIQERCLHMWTVYDHPSDYPDGYIARLFIIDSRNPRATSVSVTAPTLEEVRKLLPPGLYRLHRSPEDEPQIVETWL
jgi:hypothetical protein